MPNVSKTEAGRASGRAAPRARSKPDWSAPDWAAVCDELLPYADMYEKWRTKVIDDVAYFRERGCFVPCDLAHKENGGDHYRGNDRTPALLVAYKGESGVTHRRHDGSRAMPSYIFASGQGAVRVTDPFDKRSYIRRALANPESWSIVFDGGSA